MVPRTRCHSFALRLLPQRSKHTAAHHLNGSTLLPSPSPSSAARTVGGHSNRRLEKLVHGDASHRDSARGWLHDLLCGGGVPPRGGGSTGLVMGRRSRVLGLALGDEAHHEVEHQPKKLWRLARPLWSLFEEPLPRCRLMLPPSAQKSMEPRSNMRKQALRFMALIVFTMSNIPMMRESAVIERSCANVGRAMRDDMMMAHALSHTRGSRNQSHKQPTVHRHHSGRRTS